MAAGSGAEEDDCEWSPVTEVRNLTNSTVWLFTVEKSRSVSQFCFSCGFHDVHLLGHRNKWLNFFTRSDAVSSSALPGMGSLKVRVFKAINVGRYRLSCF